MARKKKNPVWAFFSSVKLALFLLFILAATSIIGTVVQQNEPYDRYVQEYGKRLADLMQVLGFTDMYNSWWFLSLLAIFALNLIVCSLDRIPNVIRIVRKDNLDTDPSRLEKMKIRKGLVSDRPLEETAGRVEEYIRSKGWKPARRELANGILVFAQKGGWTRFGVYVVHTSILVILLGAIIGSPRVARNILHKQDFAFKGGIMLPETRSTDTITSYLTGEKIPLGFTLRCNYFLIEYYDNGMPKTYLSNVTVLENGQEVLTTDIKVNTPLTYRGITFYQSSYQPFEEFIALIRKHDSDLGLKQIIPAGKQMRWDEAGILFGISNLEGHGESIHRVKIWFTDQQGPASRFWLTVGDEATVKRPSGDYSVIVKQWYATGLQASKDPGVLLVYLGCGLMLVGLLIAFFMSHRKIWAYVSAGEGGTAVLFAGTANKNKVGFEKKFAELTDGLAF